MKTKTIKFYRENFSQGVNFKKELREYYRLYRGRGVVDEI